MDSASWLKELPEVRHGHRQLHCALSTQIAVGLFQVEMKVSKLIKFIQTLRNEAEDNVVEEGSEISELKSKLEALRNEAEGKERELTLRVKELEQELGNAIGKEI